MYFRQKWKIAAVSYMRHFIVKIKSVRHTVFIIDQKYFCFKMFFLNFGSPELFHLIISVDLSVLLWWKKTNNLSRHVMSWIKCQQGKNFEKKFLFNKVLNKVFKKRLKVLFHCDARLKLLWAIRDAVLEIFQLGIIWKIIHGSFTNVSFWWL